MNNVKGFTFYRNYYELIKYLPNDERLKIYDAMLEFMFEDKEPNFENLLNGIWINLKMPLNTSKNNAGRGGRKKEKATQKESNKNRLKTDSKPIRNRLKTDLKTNNNISTFLFLISNNKYKYIINNSSIYNKTIEWLEYKAQRKEFYTEIGLRNLLSQIEKKVNTFGEEAVCEVIEICMSSNYKGIIFDKLKPEKKTKESFSEMLDRMEKEE